MRSKVLISCAIAFCGVAHEDAVGQSILYVDDDAPLGGNGSGWNSAFIYLQDALAAAEASGGTVTEIRIAQGTYKPDQDEAGEVTPGDRTAIFVVVDGVSLVGGYGGLGAPDPDARDPGAFETILSGDLNGDDGPDFANNDENSGHVVLASNVSASLILDGLIIQGGHADGIIYGWCGGGAIFFDVDATVRNCVFRFNSADDGGGIEIDASDGFQGQATFENCAFSQNEANRGGGLLVDGNARLIDCTFSDNEGGAVYAVYSTLEMLNCEARQNPNKYDAVIRALGSTVTLQNCRLIDNPCAAIISFESEFSLDRCAIVANHASHRGVVVLRDGSVAAFENCVLGGNISDSEGSALEILEGSSASLVNCTLVGNRIIDPSDFGVAIYVTDAGTLTLTNSIVAQNEGSSGIQIFGDPGSAVAVNYSLVEGGVEGGVGNLDADPLFVDADGADNILGTEDDDLHLWPDSPCRDAGDNSVVTTSADFDGAVRIVAGAVDMGAFELQTICGDGPCEAGWHPCNCPEDCGQPEAQELPASTCTDGVDNDCDGGADCYDADCLALPACALICGNTLCERGEDICSCPEDCGQPDAAEIPDVSCRDGEDNDCDGLYDCDDPDCGVDTVCLALPGCERFSFTGSDTEPDDLFGTSLSASGDYAVIGAPQHDSACPWDTWCNSGAAYVFRRNGAAWLEQQKLTASDASKNDRFGTAVAISGDWIVAGARRANVTGAAYVFWHDGADWSETQQLIGSDVDLGEEFGRAVAINGDTLVVGAPEAACEGLGIYCGAAYVFELQGGTWVEVAKLTASDAMPGDLFGASLAVDGQRIVVGAPWRDELEQLAGAAYVFERDASGWNETAKLTGSDASDEDRFGSAVDVESGRIVVGADGGNLAYILEQAGAEWVEQARLSSAEHNLFGSAVLINGDYLVIGARYDDDPIDSVGAAFVFRQTVGGWVNEARLKPSVPLYGSNFGISLAAVGDWVLVGADSEHPWGTGRAHFLRVHGEPDCSLNGVNDACEPDCNNNGNPDSCDIAAGFSDDCNDNSIPDECDNANCSEDPACFDCNGNGILDGCDLADCTGDPWCSDCDEDGLLDACEIFFCPTFVHTCEDCDENGILDICETESRTAGVAASRRDEGTPFAGFAVTPADSHEAKSTADGNALYGACCNPHFGFCELLGGGLPELDCLVRGDVFQAETDCCDTGCSDASCAGAVFYNGFVDHVSAASAQRAEDGTFCRWIVDDVTFENDVEITRLSWYTIEHGFQSNGTADVIVLRADGPSGGPGTTVLEAEVRTSVEFTGVLYFGIGMPYVRYQIDQHTEPGFAIPLAAGTYWIGMRPVEAGPHSTGQTWWATAGAGCPSGSPIYALYEQVPTCVTSADCPSGEPCVQGVCRCISACDAKGAWQPGANIFGANWDVAFCIHADPRCTEASDCDDGDPCTFDECVNPPDGICHYTDICGGRVLFVDDDAPAGGDGLSWPSAFNNLQDALNSAASLRAEQVWVAGGTYTPTFQTSADPRSATFRLISGVALYGGFAGHETSLSQRDLTLSQNAAVLSGDLGGNDVGDLEDPSRVENCYHVVTAMHIPGPTVLDGFTITAGNADDFTGDEDALVNHGGGILIEDASPHIRNCALVENRAFGAGAGIDFNRFGSPTISHCTFVGNGFPPHSRRGGGGGLNVNDATVLLLSHSSFEHNTAPNGGGLRVSGDVDRMHVSQCTFRGNSAFFSTAGGVGLAPYFGRLTNCLFVDNQAYFGGGLAGHRFELINCTFTGNVAHRCGGGVYSVNSPYVLESSQQLSNCILWNNYAAGQSDSAAQITVVNRAAATVRHSVIQGGWMGHGEGNITSDPLFANPLAGDFRLSADSPCVDAGDNTAVPADVNDVDDDADVREPVALDLGGRPRFVNDLAVADTGIGLPGKGVVDIGAYEKGDCNNNGVPDDEEISTGAAADCNDNAIPDACEPDCNGNGVADACDIATGASTDGSSEGCPANGIPDECEPDCNGNGLADVCDVGPLRFTQQAELPISSPGAPLVTTIPIVQAATIADVNLELDLSHTWIGDLEITIAHGGTVVQVYSHECGRQNLHHTIFDDQASGPIDCYRYLVGHTGRFIPTSALAAFNGMDTAGDWILTVFDHYAIDEGVLHEWTLHIETDVHQISSDCTANGVPDECEPDCNLNGVADSCDVKDGTSADCTGNGIPDECEADCNGNGVTDVCEIVTPVLESSPELFPIGTGYPQSHTFISPPEAGGDVVLNFAVTADLEFYIGEQVWMDVDLNGVNVGRVFECGSRCPVAPDLDHVTIPAAIFNQLVGGGNGAVAVSATEIDPFACFGLTTITITLAYDAAGPGSDCDGNGVLDECEPDCNGNGITDACDISSGFSADCNGDGVPDECPGCSHACECDDLDPCTQNRCTEGACDFVPGTYGDSDGNGTVNVFDVFCVLDGIRGDFSTCSFGQVDIHGACGAGQPECCPNGVINVFDAFAVLGGIAGIDPCCSP